MAVMVTGGAGYIGSHTCVELLQAGYDVVVVDNFDNSYPEILRRVEEITGRKLFREAGDVRDRIFLEQVLKRHKCDAVMHFAGLKSVTESTQKPLHYYDCNVVGTIRLLEAMRAVDVKRIVFSSSATVYGEPEQLPFTEDHRLLPANTYGRSKLVVEDILRDIYRGNPSWQIAILRYFNPVGAHESGLIGENPKGVPNNLMPLIAQVVSGKREKLTIWGNDYPTHDGTGVRDYIHVEDVAKGHVRALKMLDEPQCLTLNLGTGQGYSVFEVIRAYEKVTGKSVPYEIAQRRAGDIAEYYADPARAKEILNWSAQKTLNDMCQDMWNWQCKNPNGYQ
ncbi:UDP-glucose 4-epimerase GalE [Paenochrobactrum pullorum]|uniref:UDP-glucose 4-epimerase GalE n=1 Tax=Paenochrobactrum pullorum TaxID=1324351 RepID=UPI0035BBC963